MKQLIHIDYVKCLKAVLQKLPLAVLVGILCSILGSIGCFYLLDKQDQYFARSSVLTRATNEYGNAAEGLQYAELVKSLTVADRAVRIIGDGAPSQYDIYDMVRVEYDKTSPYMTSSAIITIYAVTSEPDVAITVCNAVAEGFVQEVNDMVIRKTDVAVLDQAIDAKVIYHAKKERIKYTVIAGGTGFLMVCATALMLEVLSFHLVSVQDGTLYGKLEIIGVIPDDTEL